MRSASQQSDASRPEHSADEQPSPCRTIGDPGNQEDCQGNGADHAVNTHPATWSKRIDPRIELMINSVRD